MFAAAWLAACATGAVAQSVKVGVVLPYTGVGAEFGQQVDRGMQMFMKLNPKAFEPYQVQIVKRDSKNPSGAEARNHHPAARSATLSSRPTTLPALKRPPGRVCA